MWPSSYGRVPEGIRGPKRSGAIALCRGTISQRKGKDGSPLWWHAQTRGPGQSNFAYPSDVLLLDEPFSALAHEDPG
ncbi:hypothetical protein MASR2M48_27470 [Spirochaetota bacterium]